MSTSYLVRSPSGKVYRVHEEGRYDAQSPRAGERWLRVRQEREGKPYGPVRYMKEGGVVLVEDAPETNAPEPELVRVLKKAVAAVAQLHAFIECPDCPEDEDQRRGDRCALLEDMEAQIEKAGGKKS